MILKDIESILDKNLNSLESKLIEKVNGEKLMGKVNDFSDDLNKNLKENKASILSEIQGTLITEKKNFQEQSQLKMDPEDIIFDLPSDYFSVPTNTYFFIPFILTNNSTKILPKDSFFGVKGKSDIFIEKKVILKEILPGESIQIELDCLSNTNNKNYNVDIGLCSSKQTYEFSSFMVNLDVEPSK